MKVNQRKSPQISKKIKGAVRPIKIIYNQNAGKKRHPVGASPITSEDIKNLLLKYQIPADFFPTKKSGDATRLAHDAIHEKYETVVAAGGDGTVSEVASGLMDSDITLGILPLGSYMNITKMLSIPHDLEKAVMLLKIGRKRKIDVGKITLLSGKKLESPLFFMENSSVGIEAELQDSVQKMEHHHYVAFLKSLKLLFDYYRHKVKIVLDNKTLERRVTMVAVSNGQLTGAALNLAPEARLNDHLLTVSVFEMSKKELFYYLFKLMETGITRSTKIKRYESTKVAIYTKHPKPVHADGQAFGTTPVAYEILPNALDVITGFPEGEEIALEKRAVLDPE